MDARHPHLRVSETRRDSQGVEIGSEGSTSCSFDGVCVCACVAHQRCRLARLCVRCFRMLAGYPPFFDEDPIKTYGKIMSGTITFPMHFSKQAMDLIRKLLNPKVRPVHTTRMHTDGQAGGGWRRCIAVGRSRAMLLWRPHSLAILFLAFSLCACIQSGKRYGCLAGGATLIKNHPWFAKFDWQAFLSRRLPAPIVLPVKSPEDMSNFDRSQEQTVKLVKYSPGQCRATLLHGRLCQRRWRRDSCSWTLSVHVSPCVLLSLLVLLQIRRPPSGRRISEGFGPGSGRLPPPTSSPTNFIAAAALLLPHLPFTCAHSFRLLSPSHLHCFIAISPIDFSRAQSGGGRPLETDFESRQSSSPQSQTQPPSARRHTPTHTTTPNTRTTHS